MEKLKMRHIKMIILFIIFGIFFMLVKSISEIYFITVKQNSPFIPIYLIAYLRFPYYIFIGVSIGMSLLLGFLSFSKKYKYRNQLLIILLVLVVSFIFFEDYYKTFILQLISIEYFG